MNTPNKLTDIYNKLNDEEFSSFYNANLELKKELRDIAYNSENQNDVCKAAQLEHGILLYQFAENSLKYSKMESLPFYEIDSNFIEYFKDRVKQVTNPFSLARYYNLLWLATKHNDYAIKAISNYFTVQRYCNKAKGSK